MQLSRKSRSWCERNNTPPPIVSTRRHDVSVNPAARDRRFPDAVAAIARDYNRIARSVDAADDADMSTAAPRHHRDGADLRSRHPLAVARERTRRVRAGPPVTGTLQNHVHEAGAPQPCHAGRIAAEVTARFG